MKRKVQGVRGGMIVAAALALVATVATAPAAADMFGSDAYSFLKAVKDRDGSKAQEMLDKNPATIVLTRDDNGDDALHVVTKRRDLTWLQFMLSKGATVDSRDEQGNTALMDAAQIGFVGGVDQLLKVGAKANLSNDRGETALILATQGHDIESVRLLLTYGADPRETDHVAGLSSIDYAKRDNRSAQILELLQSVKPVVHKDLAGPSIN